MKYFILRRVCRRRTRAQGGRTAGATDDGGNLRVDRGQVLPVRASRI